MVDRDEIKKLKEEIERLRKELEEIKTLGLRKGETIGEVIESILKNIPIIIEKEINKVVKDIPKDVSKKVTIMPFLLDKKERQRVDGVEIEREIDKIIDDMLPSSSHITAKNLTESLEDLIMNIDPAEVSDAMVVLANPDRIKLLQYLYRQGRYFSELEEKLHLGPSSLRHHLSKLISSGLIEQERSRGKYFITRRGVAALILVAYLYVRILKAFKDEGDEENG